MEAANRDCGARENRMQIECTANKPEQFGPGNPDPFIDRISCRATHVPTPLQEGLLMEHLIPRSMARNAIPGVERLAVSGPDICPRTQPGRLEEKEMIEKQREAQRQTDNR